MAAVVESKATGSSDVDSYDGHEPTVVVPGDEQGGASVAVARGGGQGGGQGQDMSTSDVVIEVSEASGGTK